MSRIGRSSSLVLVIALVALSLVGCGAKEKTPLKIVVMTAMTDQGRMDIMDALIKSYMAKHPGITVEHNAVKDYATAYKLAFDSGTAPEIVYVDDLNQQLLQKNNYLMDITADVKARGWIEKSIAGAVEFNNNRTPGKLYSVPFLMAPVEVYYNKDIFAKAGVTVPRTWDELEPMLAKIKSAGFIPFEATSNQVLFAVYDEVMNSAPSADVTAWYYQKGSTPALDDAFVTAFKDQDDWIRKGYFRKDFAAVSGENLIPLFGQAKSAMIMTGDWDAKLIEDTGLNIGTFSLPSRKPNAVHTVINATDGAYALYAKLDDRKKNASLDFIDLFINPTTAETFYKAGFTPSVKFTPTTTDISPLKKEMISAIAGTQMGYYLDNAVAGLLDPMMKYTQQLMIRSITPAETWQKISETYDKLRATNAQ